MRLMQLFKNTEKISELNSLFEGADHGIERMCETLDIFIDKRRFREATAIKSKGFDFSELFRILFMLPFIGKTSVFALNKGKITKRGEAQKDAYYDLLNNSLVNWRGLLYTFSKLFVSTIKKKSVASTTTPNVQAFIIDDTPLVKTGKHIEGISLIHDHVDNSYKLGFKLLLLSFFDGINIIPLDFSLHSESNNPKNESLKRKIKDLKNKMFSKVRCSFSKGSGRKKELVSKKTDNALIMLKRAVKNGFTPAYVLVDSWFVNAELIKAVRLLAGGLIHLVGMVKQDKRKYEYLGNEYTTKALSNKLLNKIHKNKKHKLDYIKVQCSYKEIPVNLFFVRFVGQQDWKVILSTDLKAGMNKIYETYQIRWTIEVLFKDCKQHLYLGKAQSNDFDAQIASTTLSFMRYITLSLVLRFENYETIGGLFTQSKQRLTGLTLVEQIWDAVKEFVRTIAQNIQTDWEILMDHIIGTNSEISHLAELFKNMNNINNPQFVPK